MWHIRLVSRAILIPAGKMRISAIGRGLALVEELEVRGIEE